MIRLLLAEDHAIVRQGLRMFLAVDPDVEIVGEAANGRDAVAMAHRLHPDVVLMDLLMPVMDGIAATTEIRRTLPDVAVVALTTFLDDHLVTDAFRAGAVGYLLKDTSADELQQAVKAAANGQVQLSPAAATQLARDARVPRATARLTPREVDVLVLLAMGCSNKEVARELRIGHQTVKTYVSSILSKLHVQTRTQAALYAVDSGLVTAQHLAGIRA